MHDSDSHMAPVDTRSYTRRSAGSAAIAALLMCAYGYGRLAAPEPDSLFNWCNLIFYYTLRIGGVGLAVVAVWCWIGHVVALAGHGVLSLLVGISFMLTGVGMLVDGGGTFNSVIITVVGWSFTATGVRDLRAFRYSGSQPSSGDQGDIEPSMRKTTPSVAREPLPTPPPANTLAGQLKTRAVDRKPQEPASPGTSTRPAHNIDPATLPLNSASEEPATESEPQTAPEGGFLADLARQGRPPGV